MGVSELAKVTGDRMGVYGAGDIVCGDADGVCRESGGVVVLAEKKIEEGVKGHFKYRIFELGKF